MHEFHYRAFIMQLLRSVVIYIYIYIDIFIKSWISFMDIVSLLTKLPSIFIICMIKYLLALILKTSYV